MTSLRATLLLLVLAGIVVGSCFANASAQGAPPGRTFVSRTGDDANSLGHFDPCNQYFPCHSIEAAMLATKPGGIVAVLDSGEFNDYSPLVIDRSITIEGTGSLATLRASLGDPAVTINAGPDGVVMLKGFSINGRNIGEGGLINPPPDAGLGSHGIRIISAKAVYLDGITISGGFSGNGIIDERSGGGTLTITNSIIRGVPQSGILATGNTMVFVKSTKVTDNGTGISAGPGPAKIGLSEVSVFGNTVGLAHTGSGMVLSFGTNEIAGNATNGAPSGTMPRQ